MDGSNYFPRREDPPENDLQQEDDPRLALLVVLLAVVIGAFLFTHRQQARALADCLIGTGVSCSDVLAPAEKKP